MTPEDAFKREVCAGCNNRAACSASVPRVVDCALIVMALASFKTMVVLGVGDGQP